MSALPVAKLAALVIKQLAKPMANVAKEKAKKSYFFRTYICMPPAQLYHRCEVRLKMWAMNLGKAVEIPQLNEAMAIELGATLVSEAVIFATGAALVIAEVVRRNKKETAQEQARLDELEAMTGRIRDLEIETMRQDAQLRELSRLCLALQTKGEPSQAHPAAPPETKTQCPPQASHQPAGQARDSSSKP